MNLQSFAASLYYALEDPMVNEIGKNPSEETVWIKKGDDRVLYHGNLRELYTYMVRTYNRSLPFLIDNYPYTFRRREDPKHRLEILQSLSDLIRENPCNWENTFVQIQFLDTNSYDESFQIIAQTVEGFEAFLKITFKEREQYRYTSEALIYGQVCNRCISENITPHVIAGIGQIYCPSNAWEALGPHLADLYDRIPLVQKTEYDIDTLHILVLEKGNGKALLHYFKTYVMEWDFFWKPVLFQIMYTLACFWKVGLQHNDLHFGNIMIEEGDYTLSYEVNTQTYFTFRTKFMVKIFDFDLATKFPTLYDDTFIRNPAAHPTGSRCREFGVCDIPNSRVDVFKVLFTLFRNSQDDEVDIKEFSSTFARLELLQMPVCTSTISTGDCWTFPGNLCGLPAGSTLGSDCVMFDDQDAIASPLQILESGYFRSYRSSTPASEKIFSMIMNEIK